MDLRVHTGQDNYCDMGPHDGMMRIRVTGYIYFTDEEYEVYQRNGLAIGLVGTPAPRIGPSAESGAESTEGSGL